jgi:hypothetical protein
VRIGDLKVDVSPIGRRIADGVSEVASTGGKVVDNIVNDIKAIWDSTSTCARELDKVRERVAKRQAEYTQQVTRKLLDNILSPTVVDRIVRAVAPQLRVNPRPQLWELANPSQAVWGNSAPRFVQATAVQNDTRAVFIFVHGVAYDGTPQMAFRDFYPKQVLTRGHPRKYLGTRHGVPVGWWRAAGGV